MNSEPLSESMPKMGKGKRAITYSRASKTQIAALFFTDRLIVQPVAMSVAVSVKQNSPVEFPPSWPTRSISMKPGTTSSQSAQVLTGICDLSKVPGFVWDRPRNPRRCRSLLSRRSIVAGLIEQRRAASSSLQVSSPSLLSIGTTIGSMGARRLPAGIRVSIHTTDRQEMTCGP